MNQTTKLASGTSGGVWKGAVAGAAVATITLVTVYEGRVSLAARQGALQLEAGESAQLAPGTAPERLSRDEPDNREVARLAQATAALRSLPRLAVPPAPPPSPKADAERPSYDDLPPVIRAVVKQVAQGRQVQNFKAKREEYKGQPTFNLDFDVDGTNHELEVDDSGRVVHAEIDLDPSDLTSGSRGSRRLSLSQGAAHRRRTEPEARPAPLLRDPHPPGRPGPRTEHHRRRRDGHGTQQLPAQRPLRGVSNGRTSRLVHPGQTPGLLIWPRRFQQPQI